MDSVSTRDSEVVWPQRAAGISGMTRTQPFSLVRFYPVKEVDVLRVGSEQSLPTEKRAHPMPVRAHITPGSMSSGFSEAFPVQGNMSHSR